LVPGVNLSSNLLYKIWTFVEIEENKLKIKSNKGTLFLETFACYQFVSIGPQGLLSKMDENKKKSNLTNYDFKIFKTLSGRCFYVRKKMWPL